MVVVFVADIARGGMPSRVSVLEKGKGKVALVGLGSGLGSGLRSGLGLHAVVPDEGANFLQLL